MTADALALSYVKTRDYQQARKAIRIATLNEGRYLDGRAREDAIKVRIQLEAATGEISDAFAWFEILKEIGPIPDDDPIAKLTSRLHAQLDDPAPLVTDGSIASDSASGFWQHTLLRRDFEFHNVRGTLDKFELRCETHGIDSAVSERAHWAVPGSWRNCWIDVHGTPGTTFQFVETIP